jgi:DNA-binding transcriptional LysR family regulator
VVDLKQLKAMVTVAEVGSVTRAAELLHLVQPAVTRQIRALEQELGVELFERTRHGMRLTDAGAVMVDRARRALLELGRARAELRPSRTGVTGIVTVGLLESTADLLTESLVTAVRRDYPNVELRVLTGYSGHLQRWLDDGDLDLSLLYNLAGVPSLNVVPLATEQLWAVAPPDDALDPRRPVSLAAVATHPIVMPAPGHALRALIDSASAQAGVGFVVSVETNSLRLQKQLVLGGHGWTILPGVGIADDVASGRLAAAPLSAPEIRRLIVMAIRRSARIPTAAEVVARELAHQVRAAVREGRWLSARLEPSES